MSSVKYSTCSEGAKKESEVYEMNDEVSPLLKVLDVANLLNISGSGVRTLARKGDLEALKFGSDWRFERSAVDEFKKRSQYNGHQSRKERLES